MDELATYAAIAEIFGAATIVGGGLFAVMQLREIRSRRRSQVAAELCRAFSEPELAKAVHLIRQLPDGASLEAVQDGDGSIEEAAQVVGMAFETMGLLVYKRVASFEIVQELAGGLLLMMWRKLEVWIKATRVQHHNPRFGEWVQWLAERVQERESEIRPAFDVHADWRP